MKDFALFERGVAVLLSSVVPCGLGHAGCATGGTLARRAARGAAALENGRHWKALEGTHRPRREEATTPACSQTPSTAGTQQPILQIFA